MKDADEFSVDPRLADDEAAQSDADANVFFDTDEELDDDKLVGETLAMTDREVDERLRRRDKSQPTPVPNADVLDSSDILNAAPMFDEPGEEPPTSGTGLTAVGFPSFDDPPQEDETVDAVEATEQSTPSEPAPEVASVPSHKLDDTDLGTLFGVNGPQADSLPVVDVLAISPSTASPTPRSVRTDAKETPSTPHRTGKSAAGPEGRQRLLLILLASYASAITLALAWLWMSQQTAQPHELESLPDVAPLDANEFRYAPQGAVMPPGHTLPLGGSEQLGYIKVEPLRVTRGPVEFSHYDDATEHRPPTAPVLKLWVRFTNVSQDQLIAPLDAALLFTRSYQTDTDTLLANQLVQSADKPADATPMYMLDHPLSSDWDLKGQQLGYRLKPGESLETYIPTNPDSSPTPAGELLWRLHFRKGYNPQTGHGVTTMVEVPFDAGQVENEAS